VAAAVEPSAPTYGIAIEQAWIPLPDGVRLATELFVPTGGEDGELVREKTWEDAIPRDHQ
jgi:predicted acyl esterase